MQTGYVFGLTGGIGSGKSTVAARFRARGLPVVNADELTRELVRPGTPGLKAITVAFGPDVLLPNGELDRRRLAARVFANPEELSRLNGIMHPLVRELADQRFQELFRKGEPIVCYEVPLLYEAGLESGLHPVVVVFTPEHLQLARTQARDQISAAEVNARLAAQLPLSVKAQRADYLIDNSGTLAETYARADRVLDAVCRSLNVAPERYPVPEAPGGQ